MVDLSQVSTPRTLNMPSGLAMWANTRCPHSQAQSPWSTRPSRTRSPRITIHRWPTTTCCHQTYTPAIEACYNRRTPSFPTSIIRQMVPRRHKPPSRGPGIHPCIRRLIRSILRPRRPQCPLAGVRATLCLRLTWAQANSTLYDTRPP